MTHLSLFSGIGGLDLAAEWAGFTAVGQCEWADYPTQVLEKHWPDVPRWRDIRTLNWESFHERTGLPTVDVISGGFPCQPFSVAGKQKGKGDDRYLWPEMLRVIRELAPCWVVGENVPGILRIAAADVVQDLEREGYNVAVFDFEAAAVGALHRRERVFFVADYAGVRCGDGDDGTNKRQADREIDAFADAGLLRGEGVITHANDQGLQGWFGRELQECAGKRSAGQGGASVPDTLRVNSAGIDGREQAGRSEERGHHVRDSNIPNAYKKQKACEVGEPDSCGGGESRGRSTEPGLGGMADGLPRWLDEPDVPRVTKGMPDRANRLKCLGNAVVPQQAYPIFRAIVNEINHR